MRVDPTPITEVERLHLESIDPHLTTLIVAATQTRDEVRSMLGGLADENRDAAVTLNALDTYTLPAGAACLSDLQRLAVR